MVIHGVGPRSSTNITLGAYCIPTKMKDQDLNWEFYYTKSLIEYLQRGQTGCERLQPKRRKIISSASPVSRIQLPPLCSWTKYKSIVMSFHTWKPSDEKHAQPFSLGCPQNNYLMHLCIVSEQNSLSGFHVFFTLLGLILFHKALFKGMWNTHCITLWVLSWVLSSILCPHMVNGEMQLEEENCNQGSGTIGGLALTTTQTNLRPTQHPQYISSLYVDLSENFLMVWVRHQTSDRGCFVQSWPYHSPLTPLP